MQVLASLRCLKGDYEWKAILILMRNISSSTVQINHSTVESNVSQDYMYITAKIRLRI